MTEEECRRVLIELALSMVGRYKTADPIKLKEELEKESSFNSLVKSCFAEIYFIGMSAAHR